MEPPGRIFSILANSHSLLQRGQALRVLSHRWMQSRWKTWPQFPQAILKPGWSASPVGLAWYSMLGSYRLLRQIAHVSVHMAQDHIATAFHFLISNLLPNLSLPWVSEAFSVALFVTEEKSRQCKQGEDQSWALPFSCQFLPPALQHPWPLLRQPCLRCKSTTKPLNRHQVTDQWRNVSGRHAWGQKCKQSGWETLKVASFWRSDSNLLPGVQRDQLEEKWFCHSASNLPSFCLEQAACTSCCQWCNPQRYSRIPLGCNWV